MTIKHPLCITPSLMAGVNIGGAWLSLGYSCHPGDNGRTRYHWEFFFEDSGGTFSGDDIQSGCQGGYLQQGFASLLSFLGSAGESLDYCTRNGREPDEDDNASLFPRPVVEWASQNSDEISMLALELEEMEGAAIEE